MPIYKWTFPAAAVGATVTVQNPAGAVVDTGTVAADTNGQPVFRTTQAEGVYTIESGDSPWAGSFETVGVLDTVASIANTPGAAETAIFVGTATGATDGSLVPITLTVSGEVKEWAPLEGGQVVLDPATAGGCYAQVRALTLLDFSGTTPPDDPDTIGVFQALDKDGDPLITGDTVTVTGDGEDEQTVTNPPEGGFVAGGTLAVGAGAAAGDVTDGVATFAVSVTVTRFVPAPPEPELP